MPLCRKHEFLLVIGPPGSGKTTYARDLPQGYLIFDLDRLIDALIKERKYYPEVRQVARQMLNSGLEHALSTGVNIVYTTTGWKHSKREGLRNMAINYGYSIKIVLLNPSPEVCLERCKKDPTRPRTTKFKLIISNWFKNFEPLTEEEQSELVR